MAAEKATGNEAESKTQMTAEGRLKDVENTLNAASRGVEIFTKLWKNFNLSDETKLKSESEEGWKFEYFNDRNWCQCFQEIPIDEFKEFAEGLEKKFNLSDDVKYSLLKGSVSADNVVRDDDFHYQDGKGTIYLVWFVTSNRNGKIDIAYAIYTLSFELVKRETWFVKWWFILPIGWEYKKEAQKLSEKQKDMFMQRCEVKLHKRVAQKCSKE